MKRKIILSLLTVFLFSVVGGVFATTYQGNTNDTLVRLVWVLTFVLVVTAVVILTRELTKPINKLEEEIRERKLTEDALKKSETFLSTIFDSIQDPFCIIDRDYRIIRANAAYAQLKYKKLDDLIGKNCFEALMKRNHVCDDCIVQKTFVSGDPCAKEKEVHSLDGIKTWIAIYTYPIVDNEGQGVTRYRVHAGYHGAETGRRGAPRKRRTVCPGCPRCERRAVGLGPADQYDIFFLPVEVDARLR